VRLSQTAKVDLEVFTVTGEGIYSIQVEGTSGMNTLTREVQNNARQGVASGLYLYVLRVDDGTTQETKVGKIAVIK
jgi:hypothetical protein